MLRPSESDDPRQTLGRTSPGNDAESELRLSELRRIGSDADVTCECELAATAE